MIVRRQAPSMYVFTTNNVKEVAKWQISANPWYRSASAR